MELGEQIPEKLIRLKSVIGTDAEDAVLLHFLRRAGEAILAKAFPFSNEVMVVPEKYAARQIEIAAYLFNKQGAEGEVSHSEPGTSRTYESASVPDSMLKGIIPQCKVVSQ